MIIEHTFALKGGKIMLDLRSYFIKLVKKLACDSNMIALIEKKGEYFYHKGVSNELCDILKVKYEDVINKNLFEIHPIDTVNERIKQYQKAWDGEEVLYKTESSLKADHGSYAVITPIMVKNKVVALTLHVIPYYMIPDELKGIA
jgi:hypothetical protein